MVPGKKNIDINAEYNNVGMEEGMDNTPAAAEQEETAEEDISVTPEQMAIMKQLATEQKYEELGRLTAELLNSAPASAAPVM